MNDTLDVMRRSEPISDDEFNEWADAMGLATPNRIAVRRALAREYERGAAASRGAVDKLREVYRLILDADVGDWDRTIPTLAQYAEAGLRELGGQ